MEENSHDANDVQHLSPLVSEHDLAARWQHSPRTLQRWRREGKMPPALAIGRRVFYRTQDVEAHEAAIAGPSPTGGLS